MDILQYAAAKEASDLSQCAIIGAPLATAAAAQCWVSRVPSCFFNWQACICRVPWCTQLWSCIPTLPGTPTGFQVCAGSPCVPGTTAGTFCQCGACLLWTVPPGIGTIRFQMWGAGGGTGSGCCCGGAPFGATGAYASIIVPAVAGRQYTICAGCACCCFTARTNTSASFGSSSFVTDGSTLSVCAEGGVPWCYWACRISPQSASVLTYGWCTCAVGAGGSPFNCWINGFMDWCAQGSTNCGVYPSSQSGTSFPGYTRSCACGYCQAAPTGTVFATIPSMYGIFAHCYGASSGFHQHPPIYGYETVSQCCLNVATLSTSGGSSCNASTGYNAIPGAGGSPVAVLGGCNSNCGDMGRAGMVCVSWI